MAKAPKQFTNSPFYAARLRETEQRTTGLEAQFGRFGEALNYIFDALSKMDNRLVALEPIVVEPEVATDPIPTEEAPIEA